MLLAALKDVRIRHVGKSPEAGHLVLIDEGGQAWVWGNNDHGQLGLGDTRCRRVPTPVPGTGEGGDIIVMVACGQRHTLLLTSQGKVPYPFLIFHSPTCITLGYTRLPIATLNC